MTGRPAQTLLGGETEYALGATTPEGAAVPQPTLLRMFMDFARRTLPYTSVSTNGRFCRNGGLLYLDCGLHMEWASPECASPHDAVRYLRAGDAIVERLAAQFAGSTPIVADVCCMRSNVDYVSRTAWASHESYLHHTLPSRLPDELVPFLASRVVIAGAGGWDATSPGLSFALSPRARFITEVTAHDTQHTKPLFHAKDETLSRTGSHRLHVSCSETLCSDTGTLLRFGATALVLAVIDSGARVGPGWAVRLASPLTALRRFSADTACRERARLVSGRRVTAIDIQRHYLAEVTRRLGTPALPAWAEPVCELWGRTLDALASGPERLAASLDWAIKRRVYEDYLRRQGIAWSALPALNAAMRRLSQTLHRRYHETYPTSAEALRHPVGHVAEVVRTLPWVIDDVEVTAEQLATLIEVRQRLFEIDMRFGQLGERGIFNTLDRAGVLTHRVAGVDGIDAAVDTPPRGTRAAIRGAVVSRLTDAGTPYGAEWTSVQDVQHRRVLDLGDPFETEEKWIETPAPPQAEPATP